MSTPAPAQTVLEQQGFLIDKGTGVVEVGSLTSVFGSHEMRACPVCSRGPAGRDGIMQLMVDDRGREVFECTTNMHDDLCGFRYFKSVEQIPGMVDFLANWRVTILRQPVVSA